MTNELLLPYPGQSRPALTDPAPWTRLQRRLYRRRRRFLCYLRAALALDVLRAPDE